MMAMGTNCRISQIGCVTICILLMRLMPYSAMGMTTSELQMCASHIGMSNTRFSATDMMLASMANSRNVNDA